MAGKRLTWVFELFDRFSPKARAMSRSVADLEKKLRKTNDTAKKHEHALGRAARATRKLGDAHKHAGTHGSGFFMKLTGWYMSMQMGIMMVRGLTSALFGLPVAFAKAGLSAASFREQSLLGMGTMLGSPGKGASVFAEADRMAKATGTPLREMVDRYQQLIAMGFEGERMRQVLAGVGDLAIVGGQDKASRALLAITQIKAKGRLSAEELMQQLAETGVDIDAVYKIIGRRTGLAKPGILKAMEKGQIGSDLGIDAVLEFIQNRYSGGKLGSMAAKYAKTGAGMWANLSSAPDRFLMDLDKSAGYQKAMKALSNLVAVLDPETPQGKRLKAKATEMFDKIFGGVFDRFQDPAAVEAWVGKLVDGFGKVVPLAERMANAVGALAQNIDKFATAVDILWNKGPITTIMKEWGDRRKMEGAAVQTGNTGYLVKRYRELSAKGSLNGFERQELANVKRRLSAAGLDPDAKPSSTSSTTFAPGAFQIQINGAQDPRAVGDEFEERLSSFFEREAFASGVR
jgi:tape measure domain-containing protein